MEVSCGALIEVAKILIDSGADINSQGWDLDKRKMDTALIAAARDGHVEMVKLLLAKGANVETQMWTGQTVLAVAAEKGQVAVDAYPEVVELLKQAGSRGKGGY